LFVLFFFDKAAAPKTCAIFVTLEVHTTLATERGAEEPGLGIGMLSRFFVLGWVLFLLLGTGGPAVGAEISARPILFVHGFNPFGFAEDCQHDWSVMETALTQQGFAGPKITIGYYKDDSHCDVTTSPHGTIQTHIRDLSKDLAWYIYDNFSSHETSIDLVAHSMGSLMIRYALYRTAVRDPDFPPYLLVTHAATMAGPFTGYSLLAESCHANFMNTQCNEMFPRSSFIKELRKSEALVPEGRDGTSWSNIGSNADFVDRSDGFVGSKSSTSMNIPAAEKMILPWYNFVFHTAYTHNKKVIARVGIYLGADERNGTPAMPEESPDGANAVLRRKDLTQDFYNLPAVQEPAKVQPYFVDQEQRGILFTDVLMDGVFARMGIQSGDVVRGCTEENINSPFDALDELHRSRAPVVLFFCISRDSNLFSRKIVIQ
jgi:triacylglycerol esterase/lipase EstA (alpha/beta hydrolase family)